MLIKLGVNAPNKYVLYSNKCNYSGKKKLCNKIVY